MNNAEEIVKKLICPKCGRKKMRMVGRCVSCRNCKFTSPLPAKEVKSGNKQNVNKSENGEKAGQSEPIRAAETPQDQGPTGISQSEREDIKGTEQTQEKVIA